MKTVLLQWLYGYGMIILGFLLFKLLSYTKRTKKHSKFNIFYWISDNWKEFAIMNILFVVTMLFFDDLRNFLQFQFGFMIISNKYFLLFLLGLFFGTVLHKLRKLLKLNFPIYPDGTLKTLKKDENPENDFVGERPDDR